jgi:hypothetical protein
VRWQADRQTGMCHSPQHAGLRARPIDTSPAMPRLPGLTPILLSLLLLAMPLLSRATPEPAYQVTQKLGEIEIRRYAAYVVAEVTVGGPADEAGNRAFPILAGYIFGKNKGQRSLEMTAPVTQSAAPVKLEMTAPVTQAAVGNGGQRVQFVLPAGVTLATAPEPLDARVGLREIPAHTVAVIRYSGFWSDSNYAEHLEQLKAALTGAGLAWSGEPVFSRYDPPFTPWFLRRNEIWLELPAL